MTRAVINDVDLYQARSEFHSEVISAEVLQKQGIRLRPLDVRRHATRLVHMIDPPFRVWRDDVDQCVVVEQDEA